MMAKNYWAELIAKACDADLRQVSPLPARMITIGYAGALFTDGILEEGDEDE